MGVVRGDLTAGWLVLLVSVAFAAPSPGMVFVDCTASRCTMAAPDRSGAIRLVLRFDHVPSVIPAVRPVKGADRPTSRCGDDRTYCIDIDLASMHAVVIGLRSIAIDRPSPATTTAAILRASFDHPSREMFSRNGINVFSPNDTIAERLRRYENNGNGTPVESPALRTGPPISEGLQGLTPTLGVTIPSPESARADDISFIDVVAIGTADRLDCSGIAVSARYILTARHCVPATRVLLGRDVAAPFAEALIDRVVLPADPRTDAALLHVARALPITPHLRRRTRDTAAPMDLVIVIGFGISNFHEATGFGLKRSFEADAHGWGCDGGRPATTGCVPGRDLVLAPDIGHDTCNGDSGGPVLEHDETTDGLRLIAITSRSASGSETGCGRGGIYLRVDVIADWIDFVIAETP